MAASVITVLFLFSCLLQSASADRQKQLEAVHPRQTVTLSCKAPHTSKISFVRWTRSDLDPDRYVYLKRDGRLETAYQDPSYVNRVQLKDDEMKNGELSLILNNVNSNDGGTYECYYGVQGGMTDGKPSSSVTVTVIVLEVEEPQIHNLTARPGDNVTLSCEAPNNTVIITAVEWIRSNLKGHVYMKIDGHLNTEDQDPSYVNRVQLKDDEMKNGELSLILKNVNSNDGGTYECRAKGIKQGRRKRALIDGEPISIVYLIVEGPTDGDAESGKLSDSGKHTEGGHLGIILSVTLMVLLVV